MRDYPVSKAQQKVLQAMNMTATGHSDADQKFAKLGLVISSKRVGRSSVPVVTVLDRDGGGFGPGGDGESWKAFEDIDTTAIGKWIE